MSYNWAYIFHAPGTDPSKDRIVIDRDGSRATLVPVTDNAMAAKVAAELAESGVQSIELCGYFGPLGAAAVFNAVQGKAAIGVVMFGSESVQKVTEIFLGARS